MKFRILIENLSASKRDAPRWPISTRLWVSGRVIRCSPAGTSSFILGTGGGVTLALLQPLNVSSRSAFMPAVEVAGDPDHRVVRADVAPVKIDQIVARDQAERPGGR